MPSSFLFFSNLCNQLQTTMKLIFFIWASLLSLISIAEDTLSNYKPTPSWISQSRQATQAPCSTARADVSPKSWKGCLLVSAESIQSGCGIYLKVRYTGFHTNLLCSLATSSPVSSASLCVLPALIPLQCHDHSVD